MEQVVTREENETGRWGGGAMRATWAKETGEEGTGKKSKSKKDQLLKTLSWKCFRWPLTSNKSSVFLNTGKSLLRSELTPATVTSQNNKDRANMNDHPVQLGARKRMYSIFQMKNIWTDWIYCNATYIICWENENGNQYPLLSYLQLFLGKLAFFFFLESVNSS